MYFSIQRYFDVSYVASAQPRPLLPRHAKREATMLETFLALITAHLLADFPLQSRKLLSRKKEAPALLLHVAIVTIATALMAGTCDLRVLSAIALSHAAMDYIKTHHLGEGI